MAKERRVEKIREGFQIEVLGEWRQVTYVSEGRSFYMGRRYYSFRLSNGTTLTRNKGARLMSRNRKEARKCGKVNA